MPRIILDFIMLVKNYQRSRNIIVFDKIDKSNLSLQRIVENLQDSSETRQKK
ncbi:MAG: hypothetical protein ACFFD4_10485 [Candidatus Odinarchaeota archaeon]